MAVDPTLFNEVVTRKTALREKMIGDVMVSGKPRWAAAMLVDQRMPTTTNRKQLAEVGIDVTGPDQIQEILDTMAMFGVYFINTKGITKEEFWDILQPILDEEITDLPPNNDMCEFIELQGQEGNNEFFNVPVKEM
jgi:hypothetical protein